MDFHRPPLPSHPFHSAPASPSRLGPAPAFLMSITDGEVKVPRRQVEGALGAGGKSQVEKGAWSLELRAEGAGLGGVGSHRTSGPFTDLTLNSDRCLFSGFQRRMPRLVLASHPALPRVHLPLQDRPESSFSGWGTHSAHSHAGSPRSGSLLPQ